MRKNTREYEVRSVVRACELLQAFAFPGEVLALSEVVTRTGMSKSTTFRLLRSLEAGQLLQRVGRDRYRSLTQPVAKIRIGYAGQSANHPFPQDVAVGLRAAANTAGIQLVMKDNRYDPRTAVRVADELVKANVEILSNVVDGRGQAAFS